MRSQKGITLISITIYVIVMAIVVGVVAIISRFFYSNVNDIDNTIDPIAEYTKFNSFFTDEVNHEGIQVVACGTTNNGQNYIAFSNGVQYTFISENNGIYRNKIKIARNVDSCTFETGIENYRNIVKVTFVAGGKTRTNTYTLK